MRRVSFAAASAAVVASVLLTACGQQAATGTGGAGTPPVSTGHSCTPGTPRLSPGKTVSVSVSDNGRSMCVKPGTGLLVYLKGTPSRKWAPIRSNSSALARRANGHLMLMLGVTGAFFRAVHPGVAVISSSRPVCGTPQAAGGTSTSGGAACDAEMAFRVTIVVAK